MNIRAAIKRDVADLSYLDSHFEAISRVSHLYTTLDIIDLRLKAAIDTRDTLEGLRESLRFTREYIARMKEHQA